MTLQCPWLCLGHSCTKCAMPRTQLTPSLAEQGEETATMGYLNMTGGAKPPTLLHSMGWSHWDHNPPLSGLRKQPSLHEFMQKGRGDGPSNGVFRKESRVKEDQRETRGSHAFSLHSCFLCCPKLRCSACWILVVKTSVCPWCFCISQTGKENSNKNYSLVMISYCNLSAKPFLHSKLRLLQKKKGDKNWENIKLH